LRVRCHVFQWATVAAEQRRRLFRGRRSGEMIEEVPPRRPGLQPASVETVAGGPAVERPLGATPPQRAPAPPKLPPPRRVIAGHVAKAAEHASFLALLSRFERSQELSKNVVAALKNLPREVVEKVVAELPFQKTSIQKNAFARMHIKLAGGTVEEERQSTLLRRRFQEVKVKVDEQANATQRKEVVRKFVQDNGLRTCMVEALCMLPQQKMEVIIKTEIPSDESCDCKTNRVLKLVEIVDAEAYELAYRLVQKAISGAAKEPTAVAKGPAAAPKEPRLAAKGGAPTVGASGGGVPVMQAGYVWPMSCSPWGYSWLMASSAAMMAAQGSGRSKSRTRRKKKKKG